MPNQVVVIGAGIGGLSAAIHARLHGHEVLVLEQAQSAGGKSSQIFQEGYRLDPGPSIVILTEIYDAVFERAGKNRSDYLQFERLDPFTRVFQEGNAGPVDLPSDLSECHRLLEQIAPGDAKAFQELMTGLASVADGVTATIFGRPIQQPWDMISLGMARFAKVVSVRKPYKDVVDGMFKSPLLRAFFYGFPSYGGQSYRTPSPGSFLIPYFMLTSGVWWPKGGIAAIPQALERLAVDLGVEFRFESRVVGFEQQGNRVLAANLESGERVTADAFISNRDRLTTGKWLGRNPDVKPSYSYFTVHVGLKKKVPELRHHTLLIPIEFETGFEELYTQRKFPSRPIVYLNETTAMEPESAPDGCTNLFAVITAPAREDHLDWERDADDHRISVVQECARHGIEIGESDVDFWRVQTPLTFEERDGNYRGSLYGPDEKERLWGMMPMRCSDEQVKNLFYCGGSVQPGAGMPMVTLSGKFAADLAHRSF